MINAELVVMVLAFALALAPIVFYIGREIYDLCAVIAAHRKYLTHHPEKE